MRMRRILELALRLRPAHVGGDGDGDFDAMCLDDASAQVVAALIVRHRFSYAQVLSFVKTEAKSTLNSQDLYTRTLAAMADDMKNNNPPTGVEFKPEPCIPASRPVFPGCEAAAALLKPAGAIAVADESALAKGGGSLRRLRSWFGPDDDVAGSHDDLYKVRRKIVMSDLPIWSRQDLIKQTVAANKVTLLQGETGSGKTTQVAAYILEMVEALKSEAAYPAPRGASGPPCRIICTQPRRIAAITVAKRVAEELGEVVGEGVVGYKVRGVSVCGPKCKILFCTTGVLLRRLSQEGQNDMFSPKTVTHLIVDEVHERNCETDFMLTFVRQVVQQREHLRVVLMSATMDAECFLRYFSIGASQPPLLKVEGRCFPTHEVFLDTINSRFGRDGMSKGMSPDELRQAPPKSASENDGIDYELIAEILKEIDSSDEGAWQFVSEAEKGEHHVANPKTGAVLIFLPGTGEISQMVATIEEAGMPEHWWVLQLHGALGAEEQQDAFKTVFPAGKTLKIIACTNVAETSVTVPDVTVVIDSCRERRTGIDKFSNTPQLKEQWCALDSLKQRRGRAGRVQPGVCIRLLTQSRLESLEGKTLPEMQRVPLENIYLQLCSIGIGNHNEFFAKTPDPPEETAVKLARAALRDLGALDDRAADGLTPLGRHLAALPCHPRLGKILVLGCLFGVPGAVLSICAAMSGRSPMMTTQDTQKRSAWQTERAKLLQEVGCKSDHCAWAVLMQLWSSEGVVRRDLCKRYGLSYERMSAAFFERRHLCESLVQAGFINKDFLKEERERLQDLDQPDVEPPDWTVVCAVIAGGLFPNVLQVERSSPKFSGPSTAGEKNKWMRYSILQTHLNDSGAVSYPKACNMHPNSLCFGQDHYKCPLLAFYTIQQTTKLYVYDATEVSPWAILLFGSPPVWNEASRRLEVGGWAHFACARGDLVLPLINSAREALMAVLTRKIKDRDSPFDPAAAPELQACVALLRSAGLGFEVVPQEPPSWPFLEQLREEGAEQIAETARERAMEARMLAPGGRAV